MPKKCPNFLICNVTCKESELNFYSGKCKYCSITFEQNLIQEKQEECHIYLKEKNIHVTFPGCIHTCRVNCFK